MLVLLILTTLVISGIKQKVFLGFPSSFPLVFNADSMVDSSYISTAEVSSKAFIKIQLTPPHPLNYLCLP